MPVFLIRSLNRSFPDCLVARSCMSSRPAPVVRLAVVAAWVALVAAFGLVVLVVVAFGLGALAAVALAVALAVAAFVVVAFVAVVAWRIGLVRSFRLLLLPCSCLQMPSLDLLLGLPPLSALHLLVLLPMLRLPCPGLALLRFFGGFLSVLRLLCLL